MRENTTETIFLQQDFDALAMAIEDGRWSQDDPREAKIVAAARARGLQSAAFDVLADRGAPAPVRERALACLAGRLLTDDRYALAG